MKRRLALAFAALAVGSISASAADIVARYTKAPAVLEPVYNWTGSYVGLNAGGAWSQAEPTTSAIFGPGGFFPASWAPAIAGVGAQRIDKTSFTGGLTGGHNWQVNTTVLGIEVDFNYFGVRGSISSIGAFPLGRAIDAFTITSSVYSDWLITLRPRGGVLVTPSLLLYGTGGLAVANVKGNFNFSSPFSGAVESGSIDSIRYGWTAGAGGEYALMNGWSIKAEYLHVDLGRSTAISTNMTAFFVPVAFPTDVFSHSVSLRSEIVRVGLNYKFGGPIVAKY